MQYPQYFTRFLLILIISIYSQFIFSQEYSNSESEYFISKSEYRLSPSDSMRLVTLPELIPPAGFNQLKTTLPSEWDNASQQYFRPLFNDVAYECGQASGIALGFNYEWNFMRGTDASLPENQIPTHFVYNFHNSGGTYVGVSYFDSWEVLRELGSPNVDQYGGMYVGGSSTRNKIWVDGYDMYYDAMHNRADRLYSIYVGDSDGLDVLKGWLYNHLGASTVGGIANFYSKFTSTSNMDILPAGTPEAGKYVVTTWSYSNHGMTVVGWNDSIRFDYNGDGQFTNNIDITGDGIVNMKDWEIGGLRFANTYGNSNNSWGNSGFAYMMYATLALPYGQGGIWNNSVHVFTAKEDCEPLVTMKIKVKHNSRDQLRFSAGIAEDTTAIVPDEIIEFMTFNGEGGEFYMKGDTAPFDLFLEFGLDVSQLLTSVEPGNYYKFFLLTEEVDPNSSGNGRLENLSLIDYTNGIDEVVCLDANIDLIDNDITMLSVNKLINFSKPEIQTSILPPAIVNSPYSTQLDATGGTEPYIWELMYDYTEVVSQDTFPMVSSEQIYTSNTNSGWAAKGIEFEFPFYGEKFDSVFISNDGYLLFAYEDFRWNYCRSNTLLFKLHRLISPFLTDLVIYTNSGYGIWYEGDANSATFRWNAQVNGSSSSIINFAITLYPDGKIDFNYGNIYLPNFTEWYGGISSGDGRNYFSHIISGDQSITPDTKITLTPRSYPEGIILTPDGYYSGTVTDSYQPTSLKVRVTDNNDLYHESEVVFYTDGYSGLSLQEVIAHGGSDNVIDFNENVVLDITLISLDSVDITNTQLIVESQDPFILFTDDNEFIGNISAGSIASLTNAISFFVSHEIPNEHIIELHGQIYADNDSSEFVFDIIAYAPEFEVDGAIVNDYSNGIADPGETFELVFDIMNIGGSIANLIDIEMLTYDPYVSIISSSYSLPQLDINQDGQIYFNIAIDASCPVGHYIDFSFEIDVDNNSGWVAEKSLLVGEQIEDWETVGGNFNWDSGGNQDWIITNQEFYEGTNSMRSGVITHSEDSYLSITGDFLTDGFIEFYFKVSCEDDVNNNNYDYLQYLIDDVEIARWDGEVPWSLDSFYIVSGVHTVKWNYHKDHSVNTGSDCAWVDFITFPEVDIVYGSLALALNATHSEICEGDSTQLLSFPDGGTGNYNYLWSPLSGLNNPYIANPTTSPIVTTEYSLLISDDSTSLISTYIITVNPIPQTPIIIADGDVLSSSELNDNQWYNSEGLIPGATNQEFVPDSSGYYFAIVESSFGCFSDTSNIIFHIPSSINNISNTNDFVVSPNPFINTISFQINLSGNYPTSIEIFTLNGKKLKDILEYDYYRSGNHIIHWDGIDNNGDLLPSGTYLIKAQFNNTRITKRIIKLN